MPPPTQSMAAVPMTERADITTGIPLTSPRPMVWLLRDGFCAMCRPMSSIFTISPTAP